MLRGLRPDVPERPDHVTVWASPAREVLSLGNSEESQVNSTSVGVATATSPAVGARWSYRGISLELTAHLIHGGTRYTVPSYSGEGWGHMYLKIAIGVHLLHWGYEWRDLLWEYDPPDLLGKRRADLFTGGRGNLPCFWFECGSTDGEKLTELRTALSPEARVVNVIPLDLFQSWWNGKHLRLNPILDSKGRRAAIRKHRADTTVPGVEYWAVYDTSTTARLLFAVRADGDDRYTYFDTGEGWSLSHICMRFRRTDTWAPLIPGIAGGDRQSKFDAYLPRRN